LFLALVLGAATAAFGQVSPEEHAAHHPEQAAPSSAATTAPATDMQQSMKSMQALMDKIEKTKNPAERARLLAQHREAMRQQLSSMKSMDCGMGMTSDAKAGAGSKMMGGMSGDKGAPEKGSQGNIGQGMIGEGGMMNGGMMKCHEMMQARMAMMVGMMEQMMRHEDAQHAAH
jgi:hypothetical protein